MIPMEAMTMTATTCPECSGQGTVTVQTGYYFGPHGCWPHDHDETCRVCHGTGEVPCVCDCGDTAVVTICGVPLCVDCMTDEEVRL
jgi:hypothetical protein